MPGPRDLLHRLGVDVARYPLQSTAAGHLKHLLEVAGATVVLDVGANQGQFATELRTECRFRGRILSFEPAPAAVARLTSVARGDDRWTIFHHAVGDAEEVLELTTYDHDEWNSLHRLNDESVRASGRRVTPTGTAKVPVHRLDGIWEREIAPTDVVFLKSDTQGHDLAVLAGAGDRLAEVCGLFIEADLTPFYEGAPDLGNVLEVAAGHGFVPSGFFPVTRRRGSLALATIDVCLVRND